MTYPSKELALLVLLFCGRIDNKVWNIKLDLLFPRHFGDGCDADDGQ